MADRTDSGSNTDKNESTEDDTFPKMDLEPKKKIHFSVYLAGVVLTVLTIMCLQVDNWGRDWTNNTAETDPDSPDEDMRPLSSNMSPKEFAKLTIETMERAPRWKVIGEDSEGNELVQIHLAHSTFLMRFQDDVRVEIVSTEDGSKLYAKSQSRIGKGDLGQNPRNIRELISRVRKKLESEVDGEN